MRCVRVWFKKMGMSRYVSHLDLMRAMTRAVRRAEIPLWYTEGFNPHPYITFALPLSLGMESLYESMDMRIEGESTNEDIFNMLKGSMPPGIEIVSVENPFNDPKEITYGEFDIFFDCERKTDSVLALIEEMLSADELIVQKLGKKGRHKVMKDINLIDFIKSYRVGSLENRVKLTVILPAGSTTNVNPSLLADEIQKRAEEKLSYTIVRKKLLLENMELFR
ncbi:MAG: TIGR03936 family radical SAM-associated protein [Clostridia bacterium]|nr:TIGR03936 family radical SAM-associated protein [Clostridia bacterium]